MCIAMHQIACFIHALLTLARRWRNASRTFWSTRLVLILVLVVILIRGLTLILGLKNWRLQTLLNRKLDKRLSPRCFFGIPYILPAIFKITALVASHARAQCCTLPCPSNFTPKRSDHYDDKCGKNACDDWVTQVPRKRDVVVPAERALHGEPVDRESLRVLCKDRCVFDFLRR